MNLPDSSAELDPPLANLLQRGVLYAWRKGLGVRIDPELRHPIRDLFNLVAPMRAVGLSKVRVGASRDGSYVMLDDFMNVRAAYSIGIGGNVSWDLDLASRGLPVCQFDHTVAGSPVPHPLFRFERTGLAAKSDPSARLETLSELLRRWAEPAEQMILKMDVEGAEWSIFDSSTEVNLPAFRQIVCEFHNFHELGRAAWSARAHRVFSLLHRTHQVVHLHRNNWGPRIWVGDLELPMLLEITFASRAAYDFEQTGESFPGPLDLPSTPLLPDPPLTFISQLRP